MNKNMGSGPYADRPTGRQRSYDHGTSSARAKYCLFFHRQSFFAFPKQKMIYICFIMYHRGKI